MPTTFINTNIIIQQAYRDSAKSEAQQSSVFQTSRTPATIANDYKELPLAGVRVLELGQFIAGPFAGQLLGQFGAEVIKVEPPKVGDLLHVWRELDVDGKSPWFRGIARNKKSVVIDLRKPEGREHAIQLGVHGPSISNLAYYPYLSWRIQPCPPARHQKQCNYRKLQTLRWQLGPEDLHQHNPSLIFTYVSGYG
ncbi:CoA-transferase family III [Macrolepiota fuliginosa MF-IS2]|uniref:CoA-transferase family III n=1 Tax=Macrolepiota fuliginosa MF-IS2 TaxID=1400762 RepID=A0A9P6BYV5_9AGAR|nr:CoA-transferase family III [Macrolepiota fuliginosa MF-IS2]